MKWRIARLSAAFMLLLSICLGFAFSSCSSTRIVTVPEYHEVFVHQRDTTSVRDSIFVHDSICITQRGDTILQKEYHVIYKDRWRDRLHVDSFIQRDTVTLVKEVERPPSVWKQAKNSALSWALVITGVFFLIIIYRYMRG